MSLSIKDQAVFAKIKAKIRTSENFYVIVSLAPSQYLKTFQGISAVMLMIIVFDIV